MATFTPGDILFAFFSLLVKNLKSISLEIIYEALFPFGTFTFLVGGLNFSL
jgi:hypothetical protein